MKDKIITEVEPFYVDNTENEGGYSNIKDPFRRCTKKNVINASSRLLSLTHICLYMLLGINLTNPLEDHFGLSDAWDQKDLKERPMPSQLTIYFRLNVFKEISTKNPLTLNKRKEEMLCTFIGFFTIMKNNHTPMQKKCVHSTLARGVKILSWSFVAQPRAEGIPSTSESLELAQNYKFSLSAIKFMSVSSISKFISGVGEKSCGGGDRFSIKASCFCNIIFILAIAFQTILYILDFFNILLFQVLAKLISGLDRTFKLVSGYQTKMSNLHYLPLRYFLMKKTENNGAKTERTEATNTKENDLPPMVDQPTARGVKHSRNSGKNPTADTRPRPIRRG
ncbi:hypothetical protein M9H77_12039 [Catharanthus roseus]|uniref:Uncharacterized protein n=1 Tax=Catharanthus roseus TaxID=4058 RepID=A0ACC0BG81_CATRO|nr:hypothetical protein M9H77_12039 [Catharanthus roseus]